MSEILGRLSEPFSLENTGLLLLSFILYVVLGLVPLVTVLYVLYFLLTLPMRRNERARMFIDLLEMGLKDGRQPEAAILDAAATHDRSLGVRFHLLAAHLEQGLRLSQALERVPRLLPLQVQAVLRAGERLGDLAKVLPACRLLLRDSVSQVRGALNYVILVSFTVTPFTILVPMLLKVKVLPAFKMVFEGMMEGAQLPEFTRLVFATDSFVIALQCGILGLVWVATLAYLGGQRLRRWVAWVLPGGEGSLDWLQLRLPWRRKRLQRDFSAMLAVLLEAGVPEAEALHLAGEATANTVMRRRAEAAVLLLKQGIKLPDAVRVLDDSGEWRWRLANGLGRAGGFVRALAGWHDALDAKAFQLEQTAAQVTTTVLVLFNGFIVASIVIGMFLALISLLNRATLW
ncbi:MAG TPA: type II secretion system F family protein [Candidatus Acidoferrum sp.]|jgi:type IV pilus assembly protein PilC|nr:type II secretion system F family protein [Candidatus Acidoferrum sp.]